MTRTCTSSPLRLVRRAGGLGLIVDYDVYEGRVRVAIVRRGIDGALQVIQGKADLAAVAKLIETPARPRLRGGLD